MGYAVSDSIVRVDQFKPTGKWYQTLAIEMTGLYDSESPHFAVRSALVVAGHNIDFTHLPVPYSYRHYLHNRWQTDKLPVKFTGRQEPAWRHIL